jgi:hypothetical protein
LRIDRPEHECSGGKRDHPVEFLHHDNPPDYFDQNSVQIFFGRVVLASASMQPRLFLLGAIKRERVVALRRSQSHNGRCQMQ